MIQIKIYNVSLGFIKFRETWFLPFYRYLKTKMGYLTTLKEVDDLIITRDHIKLIKVLESSSALDEVLKKFNADKNHLSRRLTELMIMGLAEIDYKNAKLTKEGRMIHDAILWIESNMGTKLDDLDLPKDTWINSQVMNIIKIYKETGYMPLEWKVIMEERKLVRDGEINAAANLIYDAYKLARPVLYVDSSLAEFIAGLPPGPADYSVLLRYREIHGYAENTIYAMEALRLLEISPPYNGRIIYMLTAAGRKLKEYMGEIPLYYPVMMINEKIRMLLEEMSKINLDDKYYLGQFGLYDIEQNKKTELSEKLLSVYREQTRVGKYILPIYLTKQDLKVLKIIEEAWEKNKTNKEVYPHKKYLSEKLNGKVSDPTTLFYLLEARGLVEMAEHKGKETLKLTKEGKEALTWFKNLDVDISTEAVKALTFREWGIIPSYEWLIKAEKAGLLGKGDMTKKGEAILRLAKKAKRKIYTTIYDTNILVKVPLKGSISKDKLIESITEKLKDKKVGEDAVSLALSEAESKGFIVEYPNQIVKLTEVGRALKVAIEGAKTSVITSMKVSLTPESLAILKVIKENEDVLAKTWTEKEIIDDKVVDVIRKYLSYPRESIRKAIVTLRGMGFLGRKSGGRILTGPGEQLLNVINFIFLNK